MVLGTTRRYPERGGMPRKSPIDWDNVSAIAHRGIVTVQQLDQLGVPRQTVHARTGPGGPWTRLLPGIVLLSTGTPTPDQHHDAALRYAGPDAMLTGSAALRLQGLERAPEEQRRVRVLIPHSARRLSAGYVVLERTRRLPDPDVVRGFPVAPMVRALLDAARRLTELDPIRALLAEAVQRRLVSARALKAELEAGSGRGTRLPRIAVEEMLADVHSVAESHAYRLAKRSDLPRMSWNVRVLDSSGALLGIPDGWIDEVGLAWQIDSHAYHLSPASYAATVKRHSLLTAAGVVVVHTLPSQLTREPDAVLAQLRAAYDSARRRPRPPVTAVRTVA
ncbi:hypothetical protein AB8O55_27410 [Saccharopolyspora cebuensis]|uniref:Transcriptional regulator, AbiEi antitoxin, Type IV TA system n=2 Tax=Saccharopolyspora cebuensis TaxID=418759 RepID=A0ABV4CQZ0_9PSEU